MSQGLLFLVILVLFFLENLTFTINIHSSRDALITETKAEVLCSAATVSYGKIESS